MSMKIYKIFKKNIHLYADNLCYNEQKRKINGYETEIIKL